MVSTPNAAPASEHEDAAIARTLRRLRAAALVLAALIALLLPLAQWWFTMQSLERLLEGEAAQVADELSRRAARAPERWLDEVNVTATLFREVRQREVVQAARLLDARGREVTGAGTWAEGWRVMSTEAEVLDAGVPVARLQVQADILRPLRSTAQTAAGSLLLALLAWWLIVRVAIGHTARLIERLQVVRRDAEEASLAKGAFLATMSHEIRTPMNGVLGLTELLAQTRLDAEQAGTVQTVRESAQSLLRILDDVLDFSKIEAGRIELEALPLALPPLVEGVCEALAPVAAQHGVRLAVLIDDNASGSVIGDATRLRQVLTNLVGNAIKFHADRPGEPNWVRVSVHRHGTALKIDVRDNGIGITPQAQARLFQPFVQGESSTTRRHGGTGLGLSISRRLVELMGGDIALESQPGVGTCFSVQLPLPLVPTATPAPPAPAPDLRGVQCLLLPSPALPAPPLQQWLQAADADVQTVPDLATAMALAARRGDGPVVLVHDDDSAATEAMLDAVPGAPDLRQLLIGHGRRGPARVVAPQRATLDLLRRATFLRAVAMLAGRASPDVGPPANPCPAPSPAVPTLAAASAHGRLVLVAEDDATNRLVIQRQLQALGLACEVVDDGRQALARWRRGGTALLLTDLHMPELDGYALTQAIRAEESARGLPRLPILALTANALKGEAQRARSAGIDEYLTKPVPLALLRAALEQRLPPAPTPPPTPTTTAPAGQPSLDIGVLRELVGDDEDSVRELLQAFVEQAGGQSDEIAQRLLGDDPAAAAALAHRLKSSARAVGALALAAMCQRIETESAAASPAQRQALAHALREESRGTLAQARQWLALERA